MSLKDRMPDRRSTRTIRHKAGSPAFLTRELDLSDNQQQEFDSLWQHYNSIRQEIEEEMETNRRQMGAIMSKADIDTSSFYAISALQSKLMLALDHSIVDMNLALRGALNNEQMMTFLKRIEMMNKRNLMGRSSEPHKRTRTK